MDAPIVVPAIATLALAAAVFVPLRDRKASRRAAHTPATVVSNAANANAADEPIARERSFADEVAALLPHGEPSLAATSPVSAAISASPLVLERAVPITRLPLRVRPPIAWTADARPPIDGANANARHAFLRTAAGAGEDGDELLARAYLEEDPQGRLLALEALLRHPWSTAARTTFGDAIRSGSDEERALAIDGIVANGDRESLTFALSDRLEPIAARAALAFVNSDARDDYVRLLSPLVDAPRLEAILTFLAGVIV